MGDGEKDKGVLTEGLLHADAVKSDLHPGAAALRGLLARAAAHSAAKFLHNNKQL